MLAHTLKCDEQQCLLLRSKTGGMIALLFGCTVECCLTTSTTTNGFISFDWGLGWVKSSEPA